VFDGVIQIKLWEEQKLLKAFFRVAVLLWFITSATSGMATEVSVAGFAFSGDFKTAPDRFPHAYKIFQKMNAIPGAQKNLSILVTERSKTINNPALEFRPAGSLVNLKNSDQALLATLVLSGETVSSENFGSYFKTFINLRGEALIFDYKNQTIVRSYPISVVVFDASNENPSDERVRGLVEDLLTREDGNGFITQFARRLTNATLPQPGTRTIQVKNVEIGADAIALMPAALRKSPGTIQSMLADSFGAILSAKTGVPLLPASIGHAVGNVMAMRMENGDDIQLKLGEGDYIFDLKLNKFAKIKTGETNVATSYVYGAYMNVRFYEPSINTDFIKSDFKNGETSLVPAGQISADDFPAYQDAIRGLFLKFSDAIQKSEGKWITTAATEKDIEQQLSLTREIFQKCK
jgi:hypothetical protein